MSKMTFKKVSGSNNYIKLADHKDGDIIVNGDKLIEKGVSGEESNYPGKNIYTFKSDEGETSILNGYAFLDSIMEDVEVGRYVQIIYKGKNGKTKNGTSHQFEVLVGEED